MKYNILLSLILAASAWAQGWHDRFLADSEEPAQELFCRSVRPSSLDDSLHFYDVQKMWSTIVFDLDSSRIFASAKLRLVSETNGLDRVDLRLVQSLAIDSVLSSTHVVTSFTREQEDSLQIYLSPSLNAGDTAEITVHYRGTPAIIDAWGGMRFGQTNSWRPQICYTLGDGLNLEPPPANYAWLPSYADPNDKTEWECWLGVPEGKVGVSSGTRLDTTHADGLLWWHYRLDQPVSTYLLFVSVSDYQIMTQRESDPVIENFVYPSRWANAQVHFEPVPNCLDAFSQNFGPYVFDRFGYNMTRNGDMEHATCVSHYDAAVISGRTYDWLLFHEMAHQWWGNWVTVADWRDLWLNEGFATYCEALGMEWVRGETEFRDYVRTDLQPAARSAGTTSTIYDPDYYWGAIVYEKGACVLHMLRWVMGDSLFFEAMRDYGQQFAFATATTADFQTVCETHYDSTLQWFFDEWVFEGTGFPHYEVNLWGASIPFGHHVNVINPEGFAMPLRMDFYHRGGALLYSDTVMVDGDFTMNALPNFPDSVVLDPEGWVLKSVVYHYSLEAEDQIESPASFEILKSYPNPFNPDLNISYQSPSAQPVQLRAYNVQGRLVHEQESFALPGENMLTWNAAGQASGVYWIKLSTNSESRTVKAVLLK